MGSKDGRRRRQKARRGEEDRSLVKLKKEGIKQARKI
jgi:hypothetical protein